MAPQSPSTQTQLQTPILITPTNRPNYIANGIMYELVSTLAQQAVHDIMRREFDLEWVTVCDDGASGEPVRALVDKDHMLVLKEPSLPQRNVNDDDGDDLPEEKKEEMISSSSTTAYIRSNKKNDKKKGTLLVATGRGKVRAGIFSRQHLLTGGLELWSAWHMIREGEGIIFFIALF